MRIELDNIEFKNFLSYGNVVQHLDFIEGVNLVIGGNSSGGTGRSNGIGKCVDGNTMVEICIPDNIKKDFLSFLSHFSK